MHNISLAPRNPMKADKKRNSARLFCLSHNFYITRNIDLTVRHYGTYNVYVDHYGTKDEVLDAHMKFQRKLVNFGFHKKEYSVRVNTKLRIALKVNGLYTPYPFFDIDELHTYAEKKCARDYEIYVPFFVEACTRYSTDMARYVMYIKHAQYLDELADARAQAQKYFGEVAHVDRAPNIDVM